MYPILHGIFQDQKGGDVFNCFGPWHFFYIFLAAAAIVLLLFFYNKKDRSTKDGVLKVLVGIVLGLYILDIFLMPFAYGEIDIDKLPFHACTSMCLMSFLSNHVGFLKKYRVYFAMLGCLSNLMYLCYPSGVMSYEIHPLSYRAVQTLLFHGTMAVYGILTMVWSQDDIRFKYWYRPLAILGGLTVWAILGNGLYSGAAEDYSHDFNWFFVKSDPFGIIPEDIALYICPWLNIAAFFALEMIIFGIFTGVRRAKEKKTARIETAA